uniref:Putative head-tail connector n=1 Tax=viral metagenome TaxID=1070528 RepID=A0A6M3JW91_9ZZZZ
MKIVQAVAPTIEPISLSELKLHLRLDSGSLADNLNESQSLKPDNYVVAGDYVTHVGTGIDVLGYDAIVILNSGTNGASGTVDVKIQESDDDSTYTDWTGGTFTQVTEANDNAIQEKQYTGIKQYIRTVAKVLVAACDFGTTIIRNNPQSAEDDLLNDLIETARGYVEDITKRVLLTSTWDYYLDEFPSANYFELPFGNLQSVTHLKYTDSDGDQTTMTVTTEYLVETNGDQYGRIVLPYAETWPSFTAYTSNPIVCRFVCGWTAASLIPTRIRTAVKMIAAKLYESRGDDIIGHMVTEDKFFMNLLASHRLWSEFG